MIRKSFVRASLVLACISAAVLPGCASKLDAAATAQNVTNVKTLVRHVAELHVTAKSDQSIIDADFETGKSAIRLAEAMAEAASK